MDESAAHFLVELASRHTCSDPTRYASFGVRACLSATIAESLQRMGGMTCVTAHHFADDDDEVGVPKEKQIQILKRHNRTVGGASLTKHPSTRALLPAVLC